MSSLAEYVVVRCGNAVFDVQGLRFELRFVISTEGCTSVRVTVALHVQQDRLAQCSGCGTLRCHSRRAGDDLRILQREGHHLRLSTVTSFLLGVGGETGRLTGACLTIVHCAQCDSVARSILFGAGLQEVPELRKKQLCSNKRISTLVDLSFYFLTGSHVSMTLRHERLDRNENTSNSHASVGHQQRICACRTKKTQVLRACSRSDVWRISFYRGCKVLPWRESQPTVSFFVLTLGCTTNRWFPLFQRLYSGNRNTRAQHFQFCWKTHCPTHTPMESGTSVSGGLAITVRWITFTADQ